MKQFTWRRLKWCVRVGADTVYVCARRGRAIVWQREEQSSSADESVRRVPELLNEAPVRGSRNRLVIDLQPPVVQVRHLHDLPPVRSASLRELVANQSGRFFRQGENPLVVDARWRSDHQTPGGRLVMALGVDATIVEDVVASVQALGFEVRAVGCEKYSEHDLRPLPLRKEHAAQLRGESLRLAVSVLLMWCAVIAFGVIRFVAERGVVQEQLHTLAPTLDAIHAARLKLDAAAVELEAIDEAERGRGRLARVVLGVATALPDSVIIVSASIGSNAHGTITGLAPRALDVVTHLDKAHVLVAPRLDGAPVPELVVGMSWERFRIATDTGTPP